MGKRVSFIVQSVLLAFCGKIKQKIERKKAIFHLELRLFFDIIDMKRNDKKGENIMKKISAILGAGLGVFLSTCSVGCSEKKTDNATFDYEIYGVGVEQTLPLSWTGLREDVSIDFTSSDEAVATVNASGEVVGKSIGSATITAKSKSEEFTCTVEVNDGQYTEFDGEETFIKWEGRNFTYKNMMHCYNTASGFEALFYGTSFTAEIAAGKREYPVTLCVMIDDKHTPENNNIVLDADENVYSYTLAENLEEGFHRIRVYKLTEAYESSVAFKSVSTDGYFWARPKDKKYKIEVYGDSITTGVDNLENVESGYLPQNGCMTYCWLAAEQVNADINVFARSGIGMNWSWDMGIYMKSQYKRTYCAEHNFLRVKTNPTWNFKSYIPDAVIINVGTNDSACYNGFDESGYINEMVKLCQALNESYGTNTKLLFVKLGSGSPHVSAQRKIVEQIPNAEQIILSYSGNVHPTVTQHKAVANELAGKLKEILP